MCKIVEADKAVRQLALNHILTFDADFWEKIHQGSLATSV